MDSYIGICGIKYALGEWMDWICMAMASMVEPYIRSYIVDGTNGGFIPEL